VPAVQESVLAVARRLGQAGRAEEALGLLVQAEGERVPSPDELHLTAVLARALGRDEQAQRALTRALYLDPRHVASLRLAALVAEERGEREAARRLEARAARAEAGASAAEAGPA
jgi:chemotaxis protein methyltransferase WspC